MQAFFLNIYNSVKDKLCERRNTRVTFNKFAVLERTDVLVRKPVTQQKKEDKSDKPISPPSEHSQSIDIIQSPSQQIIQQTQKTSQKPEKPENTQNQQIKVQIKPCQYTLQSRLEEKDQYQTDAQFHDELIQYQMQISKHNSELESIYKDIKHLQEEDRKRKKHFWKNIYQRNYNDQQDPELSNLIDQNQTDKAEILNDHSIKLMYRQDVQEVRQFKYSGELKDYPEISLEVYSNIRNLWVYGRKHGSHVIKKMGLKMLEKLTAKSFRTLSFGAWLNDQIINGYLEMIDEKAFQMGRDFKVLNSFFAQTTFSKSPEMIQRALKRRNITRFHKLIIAINNGSHWFFALIRDSQVIVYDSIPKSIDYYLDSDSTHQIFHNILNFAQWFYGSQHIVKLEANYPQQQNSYDCGMFLLCGIKDIVRQYPDWSFSQSDINYKRVLVAKELLDQKITGF